METTSLPKFTPIRGLLWLAALLYLVHFAVDALKFHEILRGNYGTPWHSSSWLAQPYTNLRLIGKPKSEYWTKNAVGDHWYVKDVTFDGKKFWTILKTVDKSTDEAVNKVIKH
jgi:hypothetical protein